MKPLFLWILLLLVGVASAQELAFDTKARSAFFESHGVPEGNKLVIFMSTVCPLCKNYTTILNELSTKYGEKIMLNYVFSGREYNQKLVDDFSKQYNLVGYKILDTAFFLSKAYQVSVTPEVILLDEKNKACYQGAIDNWLEGLGRKRVVVTAHYLDDAIKQFISNKPISVPKTEAKGCLLNDY